MNWYSFKKYLLSVFLLLIVPVAQASTQEPVPALQFFKMILGLAFVIAIIVILAWMIRRFSNIGFSSNSAIRMETVLPIGNKEKLIIVRADKCRLLLGVTATQIKTLAELNADDGPELPADATHLTNSFSGILKRAHKMRKQ